MDTDKQANIIPINIADEMRTAYIDYSMSVIVSRALPDVRDGLKPVHRRVLYGMYELGITANKPLKKAARIVGEVLGKYHPHGDGSVYDAMVRMAQDWTLRYPLIQGQGNFGSIDGDQPAAMRYTEARLARTAEELLGDLNKETVDFQTNFDDSLQEPTVLPAKLPNLLINGSSGIAVGMATNMPPHNLCEVVDGIAAYIDNPDITIEELMQYIKGPDFPTGGIIYGYQGIEEAYKTGKGRVIMRAKTIIETAAGKEQIIVTEIPYMVNKALLIEKTAQLVNDKKIEGIADIRDESDKDGLRIVYELKKDAMASVVLNNLYKYTALQASFGVNNVALVGNRPQILNLKDLVHHFVNHRHTVFIRKTEYELNQAQKRLHVLEGYLIALDNLDAIIQLIRQSKDAEVAKHSLIQHYQLTDIQAKAILEMRLQRLTGMEREKIIQEHQEVGMLIAKLENILNDQALRMQLIKEDLLELKEKYGDARRTVIEYDADEISLEDIIPEEEMVISISSQGYIKRTSLSEYRIQARGGIGARSSSVGKDDDFVTHLFVASTHHYLLIFTNFGKVYWKKVYTLPESGKTAKGRAIQNLLPIAQGEQVQSIIKVKSLEDKAYVDTHYLLMCTKQGIIKKTSLTAYANPRTNGIHAININEGDELLEVSMTKGDNHIIIALKSGRAIHFNEREVRPMGRVSTGVRGIRLADANDQVVGMVAVYKPEFDLLVVSEKGVGKRSAVADYRITKRGGKGIKTLNITDKTGALAVIKAVTDTDEVILINKSGIAIRIAVAELRVMGRNTQGVRLIKLSAGDAIASVAKINASSI